MHRWPQSRSATGPAPAPPPARTEESYDGATLGAVLDQAAAAHGAGLARVLSVASFLVDGVRTSRDAALADGATVEVLPPFAGGSR